MRSPILLAGFASVEFRAAKRNLDRRNSDTPRNFIRLDFVLHLKFKASEILRVKISKGENSEDEILDSKI